MALLHSDEFEYDKVSGIFIFDKISNPKNEKDHIIFDNLDIVLIPITQNTDISFWSNESFWHINHPTQNVMKLFPEVFYGGYSTKENGADLYENKTIKKHITVESSCYWNYKHQELEIDISSTLYRDGIEYLDGMSGGPIFGLKINSESNITLALLGIITHRSKSPPRIFGTTFLEIFENLNRLID